MEPGARVRKRERNTEREGKRERQRERGGERALVHTEDSFIRSLTWLQFFLPLLCFLFCFHSTDTVALSPNTSRLFPLCPPSPSLPIFSPSSGWFWTTACHHQQPPPPQVRIHGGKDQQDSGREFVRWSFNESEASSARKKCMLMICTHQKDPG